MLGNGDATSPISSERSGLVVIGQDAGHLVYMSAQLVNICEGSQLAFRECIASGMKACLCLMSLQALVYCLLRLRCYVRKCCKFKSCCFLPCLNLRPFGHNSLSLELLGLEFNIGSAKLLYICMEADFFFMFRGAKATLTDFALVAS